MNHTLLIATGNPGKVKEIRHEFALAAAAAHDSFLASLTILGLKDLPAPPPECVEDQPSFEGNARKKARHYAAFSNMLTLADDSGLCVDALAGAPGVYSARYAGVSGPGADAANNAKLLAALDRIPDDQRQARFVCAMALAVPTRDLALTTDQVPGILLRSPRGENGFGYDPLFYFPQFSKTTAELDMTTKSQISHRGKALRKMIAWLGENQERLRAALTTMLPWGELKAGFTLESPPVRMPWSFSPRDGEILFHVAAELHPRKGVDWAIQVPAILPGGMQATVSIYWTKGCPWYAEFALIPTAGGMASELAAIAMRRELVSRYGLPSSHTSDGDLGGEERWKIDKFCVRLGWFERRGRNDYLRVEYESLKPENAIE